jgi:hypothetical protein
MFLEPLPTDIRIVLTKVGVSLAKHFSVNVSKNAFKCFYAQCAAHGKVLDFVTAMEQCSIRDAGLKLKAWFKIGDTEQKTENESAQMDGAPEVTRGIYTDKSGALYEVITSAVSAEDFETPCRVQSAVW